LLRSPDRGDESDEPGQDQSSARRRDAAAGPGERTEKAERCADPAPEEPPRRTEQPCAPVPARPVAEAERPLAAQRASAPPEPPLQQLAAQMLRGVSIQQLGDQTSLRMELSTPKLSRVGLSLQVDAGRLTARFSVPDLAGRELIRSAAEQLEAGLGARGIAVETIQVEVQPSTRSSRQGAGRDSGHGRQGGGEDPKQRRQPKRRGRGFVL
jgi:hypothetical protein